MVHISYISGGAITMSELETYPPQDRKLILAAILDIKEKEQKQIKQAMGKG